MLSLLKQFLKIDKISPLSSVYVNPAVSLCQFNTMMGFCVSVFVLDLFHEIMWFHLKVQAVYLLVKFLISLLSYQMFLQSSLTPQANPAAVCRTSCSQQRNLTCLFVHDMSLVSFPSLISLLLTGCSLTNPGVDP